MDYNLESHRIIYVYAHTSNVKIISTHLSVSLSMGVCVYLCVSPLYFCFGCIL